MIYLIIILIFLLGIFLYLRYNPHFGKTPDTSEKKRLSRSKQWKGNKFENFSRTNMNIGLSTIPKLLKERITKRKYRSPSVGLPILGLNQKDLYEGTQPKFIWYGHSVVLLRIEQKNFLIDPMFGPDASPIAPWSTKRFSRNTLNLIDNLPEIEAVLLSHDHYDHLDLKSIQKLKEKSQKFMVALGVARHLEHWGIASNKIREFDWWDTCNLGGVELSFTPTRHFSGRGPFDRTTSLWGGWVFSTSKHNIYWSGDSGYDSHFKLIGQKLGPFDWGFMECGQYNPHWAQIHMFPEETVQASIDARVKTVIPVHWAGFDLSLHSWKEPVERFVRRARERAISYSTPKPGELIKMYLEPIDDPWWKYFE